MNQHHTSRSNVRIILKKDNNEDIQVDGLGCCNIFLELR